MATTKPGVATASEAETDIIQAVTQDRNWSSQHPINLRLSIPLPFGTYYLVIIGGKERRSNARRAQERVRHRLWTIGNFLVFLTLGTLAGLATLGLLQILGRYALDAAGVASF